MRRARNIISRVAVLAAAAADLLDRGHTDQQVADALNAEHAGYAIKSRTVAAYRSRDYERHAQERIRRREAAAEVALIMDGGAGTYARAGQDLLSRMFYEMISAAGGRDLDSKELVAIGKTLAKIREIEIAQIKAETEKVRADVASEIRQSAGEGASPEDLVARVDQIMGIKR